MTPKTAPGIGLFHRLVVREERLDDHELARAIRDIEDEPPPDDYSGLIVIGLWVIGIVVGWLARGAA